MGRMHSLAIRDPCVRHRQAHTERAMTGRMHQASVGRACRPQTDVLPGDIWPVLRRLRAILPVDISPELRI